MRRIADKGFAIAFAKRDVMTTGTGGNLLHHGALFRVDDRNAAITADPQVSPVLLQHEADRLAADLDVRGNLPDRRIDHREFIGRRQRHEQGARIAPHHPILARTVERDQGNDPLTTVTEQRIDNGDAGLAIERQDVPGIEINVRPVGQTSLEKVSNLLPTCVHGLA